LGALSVPVAVSAQGLELKPNLRAFPAYDIAVVPDSLGGTRAIFSTLTWNNGDGALELVAGETGTAGQNVYQRVYLDDGGFYDHHAGTFDWHVAHNHFHFGDYALYTLQPVNAPGGSKRTSSKTTFCVMDTNRIDRRLPNAPKKPNYTACGDLTQGMDVGWGDECGSNLAGQWIDLTGLPDGDYSLTIEADPKNHLVEINENDNTSCVLLRIGVTSRSVEILDDSGCGEPGGGEELIAAIDPNIVSKSTVTAMTITGSGFADGVEVAFEGSGGQRPTASDVTVVDESMITANVTVRDGGPARTRIWDVRVGSDVLLGGFTVEP
jgi:hypothetical protein